MAIDADTPGSPGWWLLKLESRLIERRDGSNLRWNNLMQQRIGRPPLTLLDAHLRGDPPLPPSSAKWQRTMREFLRKARMNYTELIVDSVVPKLIPTGFRTGVGADRNGDAAAAEIFKANQLDLEFTELAGWMLGLGDAYMCVGPPVDGSEIPLITAEHPFEMITADDPQTRTPRAALKLYRDEWDDVEFAQLRLPGKVLTATRAPGGQGAKAWDWSDALSYSLPTGLEQVVAVRHFRNRRGVGEFEPHLDVIDRINDGIFERLVISKYQAFRQRAVRGLPEEDEHGVRIDWSKTFTADPGAFWQVDAGVDFWESQPIDLGPIRMAIKDDVQALAAATSTALHLFSPEATQGSAEGATLVRESGTWKASDRRRRCSPPLRGTMGLAFLFAGDSARSDPSQHVVLWEPVERYSLAERYDAAVKAKAAGEPYESTAQNVLQYSPEEISWQMQLRAEEQLLAAVPTAGEQQAALSAAGLAPQFVEPSTPAVVSA